MRNLLVALLMMFSTSVLSGEINEMHTPNEGGGIIALTTTPCPNSKWLKQGFLYRSYATEANGTVHEGCWISPSIEDAPRHPAVRIIPVVNSIWEGDTRYSWTADIFRPAEYI